MKQTVVAILYMGK